MNRTSEEFGRLLKAGIMSIASCEGKLVKIIEEELGQAIGLSDSAVERYKTGHLPPYDRTIEILAEAAVQRGLLGHQWLTRFLRAARYPFADQLIDRLCPATRARAHPPRVYENLPAPTYSQFVMRDRAFAEVIDSLQQRSAAVLIVGMGGNGKTSLAREVAARCLQQSSTISQFDAAVWISDKDRPGTTNLSRVLDEIARTLDYPGFIQLAYDEKLYEVGQLLKRQHVLVVVDNFETITDGALLSWLLRLPEPSKALITSREDSRAFRNSTIVVDLRGLSEEEAQKFVSQRLHILRIERRVSDAAQLEPLLAATSGNPKALEIALGIMKHERRPLQHVVDDLYAARGELFNDLFTRAWELLDEAARRVLMVMTFFSASASGEAVATSADVQGFAFDHAVERLTDISLLDVQQEELNSTPRYTLHPLVRAFVSAKFSERPGYALEARNRWMRWCIELASKVGFCWNDLSRLALIEPEEITLHSAVTWAFQNQYYTEALQIAKGVGFYFYVRVASETTLTINEMRFQAASKLADTKEEIQALVDRVMVLSRQGNITNAAQELARLQQLARAIELPLDVFFEFQHASALFALIMSQNISAAQQLWQSNLQLAERIGIRQSIVTRGWLAICLYQQGEQAAARQLFREVLQDAIEHDHQRAIAFNQWRLAVIDLDEGNLEEAAQALSDAHRRAEQYQDRECLAHILFHLARLHTLQGDLLSARSELLGAMDLFERLALRREYQMVQTAIEQVERSMDDH